MTLRWEPIPKMRLTLSRRRFTLGGGRPQPWTWSRTKRLPSCGTAFGITPGPDHGEGDYDPLLVNVSTQMVFSSREADADEWTFGNFIDSYGG